MAAIESKVSKELVLNTGFKIPTLGLGTWRSENVYDAIRLAFKLGYRHLDCAASYSNESDIGRAIADSIKDGEIKREEIFVTSKLWNTNHHPQNVEPACRKTLAELKVDYLDLYLVHWPVALQHGDNPFPRDDKTGAGLIEQGVTLIDTWKAMEELVKKGLVRSIGVSNFSIKHLQEIIATGATVPAANQIESHPYLPNQKLRDFCSQHKIIVEAYSPFGSSQLDAMMGLGIGNSAITVELLRHPVVLQLAEKYQRTPGQIVLRWSLQQGNVPLPKSASAQRLQDNLNLYDFNITDEDLELFKPLSQPTKRIFNPTIFSAEVRPFFSGEHNDDP